MNTPSTSNSSLQLEDTPSQSENSLSQSESSIVFFTILVLLLGFLGYLPWVLSSYGLISEGLIMPFMFLGGGSPTIAAVIAMRKKYGALGPKILFESTGRKRTHLGWYVFALVVPFLAAALSAVLYAEIVGSYSFSAIAYYEIIPLVLANLIYNMWEEIGWRTYALSHLQTKYRPVAATFILAILEIIWHLPHLLVKNSDMIHNFGNVGYFVLFTFLFVYMSTWLFNRSQGKWFLASVFHAAFNGANMLWFSFQGLTGNQIMPLYIPVMGIMSLLFLGGLGLRSNGITIQQIIEETQAQIIIKQQKKAQKKKSRN